MTKKSLVKRLQSKCEKLWKLYALRRDKVCQLCGGKEVLQVHHVFSRKNKRLFLDIQNSATLCRSCHMKVTWDDSAKETLRRKLIAKDKDAYERLYEVSLDKSLFLEFKNISWLETQLAILTELIAGRETHEEGVTKQFDWGKKRKKMTLQELNRELDKITKKLITDRRDS